MFLLQEQEKKFFDLRKNDILFLLKNYMIDENKGLVIVSVGNIGMGIIGVKVNKWK